MGLEHFARNLQQLSERFRSTSCLGRRLEGKWHLNPPRRRTAAGIGVADGGRQSRTDDRDDQTVFVPRVYASDQPARERYVGERRDQVGDAVTNASGAAIDDRAVGIDGREVAAEHD